MSDTIKYFALIDGAIVCEATLQDKVSVVTITYEAIRSLVQGDSHRNTVEINKNLLLEIALAKQAVGKTIAIIEDDVLKAKEGES